MNDNSFIKDIGRSYIVSSFLPATLFVTLSMLLFRGFVPQIIAERVIEQDTFFTSQFFLFLAFTSWVSFLLYSMVNWTMRFYEGYYFPHLLKEPMLKGIKSWHASRSENIQRIKEMLQSVDGDFSMEQGVAFWSMLTPAKREYAVGSRVNWWEMVNNG